jgi:hypothetical protein
MKDNAEHDWASSQAQHPDGASPKHAWTCPPCTTTHASAKGTCSEVEIKGARNKAHKKK